jgi:hypothetical protein
MTQTMAPADLAAHQRYGLALRRDLTTDDGTVIPAWTELVNVGQPSGVTVSRHSRLPVAIVICRSAPYASPVRPGEVYLVGARSLLVALGEIEA